MNYRSTFLPIMFLLALTGCQLNSTNPKAVNEIINEVDHDSNIRQYLSKDMSVDKREVAEIDGDLITYYDFIGTPNSKFKQLDEFETYDVLYSISEIILKNADSDYTFECGENETCSFGRVKFDDYSIGYFNKNSGLNYIHNGVDMGIETEIITIPLIDYSTNTNSKWKQSMIYEPWKMQMIYDYMKNQYNKLTTSSENYNLEVHGKVLKMASVEFGITTEEAGRIFYPYSWEINR